MEHQASPPDPRFEEVHRDLGDLGLLIEEAPSGLDGFYVTGTPSEIETATFRVKYYGLGEPDHVRAFYRYPQKPDAMVGPTPAGDC
jgi:hypothetical protein